MANGRAAGIVYRDSPQRAPEGTEVVVVNPSSGEVLLADLPMELNWTIDVFPAADALIGKATPATYYGTADLFVSVPYAAMTAP